MEQGTRSLQKFYLENLKEYQTRIFLDTEWGTVMSKAAMGFFLIILTNIIRPNINLISQMSDDKNVTS